jgi:hypothetical protein
LVLWPARDPEEEAIVEAIDGEMLTIPYAKNNSSCDFNMDVSPQIESVSYSSDGKTLDVTLWLSSSFEYST